MTTQITATPVQVTNHQFTDQNGHVVGLAVHLPSTVMVYGHDYDEQPAAAGFLYLHLGMADDVAGAERLIHQHAEIQRP